MIGRLLMLVSLILAVLAIAPYPGSQVPSRLLEDSIPSPLENGGMDGIKLGDLNILLKRKGPKHSRPPRGDRDHGHHDGSRPPRGKKTNEPTAAP